VLSHDLQRGLGAGQVAGQRLVLAPQPLHLGLLGARAPPSAPRSRLLVVPTPVRFSAARPRGGPASRALRHSMMCEW